MPNSDLLPSLLYKINENQLALEAAIMELSALAISLLDLATPRFLMGTIRNRIAHS